MALPDLGVDAIKAKVDTGAATSPLHADEVEELGPGADGERRVRFVVHPVLCDARVEVVAAAPLVGWRKVRSSNGQVEERPVVSTSLALGPHLVVAELTLTRRDLMGFRMLLGRPALRRRFLVDPGRSFLTGHRAGAPGDSAPRGRADVKIVILSRNSGLYSTRRLNEAGEERGHEVRVIDYLRCYMNITAHGRASTGDG